MKVWIVLSDLGMNGSEVRDVFDHCPPWAENYAEIERQYSRTWTGYSGTEVVEFEVQSSEG